MPPRVRLQPAPHLSMEDRKRTVFDEIDAQLLRRISETHSITEAAKLLGISYRNAWDRIRRMESRSGKKMLKSSSGGTNGGSSSLTPEGMVLLKEFRRVRRYLFNALDDQVSAGNIGYKLSARNRIDARITGIEKGDITSLIKLLTVNPVLLTSIISKEAVDDLGLQVGDKVEVIIKSTEVMVGKVVPTSAYRKAKADR
ncbi:MAG TPA: TOBE domain-containing protein [Nitrososphaerales archaeon]|nr:TOBE domain-containing protein [Nitrososphaerales archaeon]